MECLQFICSAYPNIEYDGQAEGFSDAEQVSNLLHRTLALARCLNIDTPPFLTAVQLGLIYQRLEAIEEAFDIEAEYPMSKSETTPAASGTPFVKGDLGEAPEYTIQDWKEELKQYLDEWLDGVEEYEELLNSFDLDVDDGCIKRLHELHRYDDATPLPSKALQRPNWKLSRPAMTSSGHTTSILST